MEISKLLLTGLLVISSAANAKDMITDAQALNQAKETLKYAIDAKKQLDDKNITDKSTAYKIQKESITRLYSWPDDLSHRALFPYHNCESLLSDLQQQAANIIKPSKIWEDHNKKNWKDDLNGCQAAIKKPDLTLKNVQ